MSLDPFIVLHPEDNVLVCRAPATAGQTVSIDGAPVVLTTAIEVGHKIARHDLKAGDKILKYGAPIGSMTEAAKTGAHIHMHNMKSDYISSHTRDVVGDEANGNHG